MILSSQEPTEVPISKLKFKFCRKNQKCILVTALNPKILYMRFITARLNARLNRAYMKQEAHGPHRSPEKKSSNQ